MELAMEDCKEILTDYVDKAAKFNKYQRQLKVKYNYSAVITKPEFRTLCLLKLIVNDSMNSQLDVTNYDALDHLIFQVRLRHQLWESMHNWDVQRDVWENASFAKLDDEDMTKEVVKYVKSIHQLEKGLPSNEVVPILKAKVEAMKIQARKSAFG